MQKEKTNIVYRYCSPYVFGSIIEHQKIWLCDMMKTNDYREINYVLDDIVKTANAEYFLSIMSNEDAQLVEKEVKHRIDFYRR